MTEGDPGVFLLPFALPEPFDVDGVAADVLARRLPDLLHQLLNAGHGGPAGMLEVQSPPGDGPPRWVTLSDVPSPDEVWPMLGGSGAADALVAGALRHTEVGLVVELTVHVADPGDDGVSHEAHAIHALVRFDDPATDLITLAAHVAELVDLPFEAPGADLLSRDPTAFFHYLVALDGAALLSADPDLESERFGEDLLRPLADALRADPAFGLALRTLAQVLFPALQGERVPEPHCLRVLDECLACGPRDGRGCVEVAEQLAVLGHDARARAWLEHAVGLEPPASRALETLGVQLANDGETVRARTLWRRGLELDGHPDFYAHLARLAFLEDSVASAWDLVRRGLRRKRERTLRAAEWDDDGRGASALLRYVADHLAEHRAPTDVAPALAALAGLVVDPIERVDLGICLHEVGRPALAVRELRAGLDDEDGLPPGVEDRAVRALLALEVPEFEQHFAAASDRATKGRDPRRALVEMQALHERQPAFWPALYFAAVALRRLGREDEALDLMAEVARRRPDHADSFAAMAELFDRRGNAKRALECVDDAIALRPEDGELHVLRAQFLEHLGRAAEADAELERAIKLEPRGGRRRRSRRRV